MEPRDSRSENFWIEQGASRVHPNLFADAVFDTEQTQVNRVRKLSWTESVATRLLIEPLRNLHEDIACHGHHGAASLRQGSPLAEGDPMMNGGMWGAGNWMGGNGGMWVPIILAVVVVGVVAWLVKGRGK